MTPDELAAELARGVIRPAYLLAGEEALLRDDALAALRAAVLEGGAADFNFDRLDGDSLTASALIDAVGMLPVMAPRRLVVLREPEGRRAGAKALLESLGDLVGSLEDGSSTVLVVCATKADRRARWVKAFSDPRATVACDPPRGGAVLTRFVRAEADRQGVRLGRGVAELLAERVGPQLMSLRQEIAKVALAAAPGHAVDRDQAAASTSLLAEEPIWDLTDAIGEGRAGEALAVLGRLLDQGVPAPVILGSLASHFRRLLRAGEGGDVAGPPFVVKKLVAQARRYPSRRLLACVHAIHESDEVLKGRGSIEPRIALERLVMGLSA